MVEELFVRLQSTVSTGDDWCIMRIAGVASGAYRHETLAFTLLARHFLLGVFRQSGDG